MEQLGEVSVQGAFLIEKRADLGTNVFTITMKTTARVWILQAPDEATMNQWITLCSPLMKETATVVVAAPGAKKPSKPAPGLPLQYPPKYVQGFTEREQCWSNIQNGDDDWTKLSQSAVAPVKLQPGQVALALDAAGNASVEEVRELTLDKEHQAVVTDLPKQLKYSADTLAWTSGDSQLLQARFVTEEKTQRELLRQLAGRRVTCSVPSTGAGHHEDAGKRQETRLGTGGEGHHHHHGHHAHGHGGGAGLVFPAEAKFSGVLFYDGNDERYALVNEASQEVHFLNTKDARTIKVDDAGPKLAVFRQPQLQAKFAAKGDKAVGQLTYSLHQAFELHTNYVLVLSADERSADLQGWFSINNKTSKTYTDATLTLQPGAAKEPAVAKKEEEGGVEEVVEDEAKKEAKKRGFGGVLNVAAALLKKEEVAVEPAPEKVYRYPVVQKVTLPSYDWAHVAFVGQNVAVRTLHLATFNTPSYTIKPVVDQLAGTDAEAQVRTVARFANPLSAAIPSGTAEVKRRDKSGLGVVKVADTIVQRVEGGEVVTLGVENTWGVRVSRKQTGYNFDAEKHFIIETFEISVANGRHETVNVTVEESLFRWSHFEISASKPQHSVTSHPRRIAWDVRLNHGEDITIKYTVFYSAFALDTDYEQPSVAPVLGREGPFVHPGFEPTADMLSDLAEVRVLVIGAGGLGCDILKCLALSGFRKIDVIDMDTIDPSNLNRQFLFRHDDIDQPKARVASAFINRRIAGAEVTGHYCRIQDKDAAFYRQFRIVVCGLDNVDARRWMNSYLHNLLEYTEEDGGDAGAGPVPDPASVIFLVDAGTEGFRGNIRVIVPGSSSCIDCNLDLFPPEVKVPLCTIAATPRNVAHCIQYAALIAWPDLAPFKGPDGAAVKYDTDNVEHMTWIMTMAQTRALEFHVTKGGPVDMSKTLGVVKNIIPAIASTNALISAAAVNEAFKIATSAGRVLENYMLFNAEGGAFTTPQCFEKNAKCEVCGNAPRSLMLDPAQTLQTLLDTLLKTPHYALQNPRLISQGGVLWSKSGPEQLRRAYQANLSKPVSELLESGDILTVSDDSLPGASLNFSIRYKMDEAD